MSVWPGIASLELIRKNTVSRFVVVVLIVLNSASSPP